jgi:hypothetical protein
VGSIGVGPFGAGSLDPEVAVGTDVEVVAAPVEGERCDFEELLPHPATNSDTHPASTNVETSRHIGARRP